MIFCFLSGDYFRMHSFYLFLATLLSGQVFISNKGLTIFLPRDLRIQNIWTSLKVQLFERGELRFDVSKVKMIAQRKNTPRNVQSPCCCIKLVS